MPSSTFAISALALFVLAPDAAASKVSKEAALAAFAAEDAVAYPSALSVSLVQVNRARIKRAVKAQQAAEAAQLAATMEEPEEGLALIQTNAKYEDDSVQKKVAFSVAADGTL